MSEHIKTLLFQINKPKMDELIIILTQLNERVDLELNDVGLKVVEATFCRVNSMNEWIKRCFFKQTKPKMDELIII